VEVIRSATSAKILTNDEAVAGFFRSTTRYNQILQPTQTVCVWRGEMAILSRN